MLPEPVERDISPAVSVVSRLVPEEEVLVLQPVRLRVGVPVVVPVRVPPLKERGEDALLLARFFLKRYCETMGGKSLSLSREAEKAILLYDWPGNVREIQNRVQRAVITAAGSTVGKGDLDLEGQGSASYTSLAEARSP